MSAAFHVTRPASYWPADRVRDLVRDKLDRLDAERPNIGSASSAGHVNEFAGARTVLAAEAGVSIRWLQRLLSGESASVEVRKVDAVFLALDLGDYFYLEPEDGGLRDLYYREAPC
jgi:hypothetical protein